MPPWRLSAELFEVLLAFSTIGTEEQCHCGVLRVETSLKPQDGSNWPLCCANSANAQITASRVDREEVLLYCAAFPCVVGITISKLFFISYSVLTTNTIINLQIDR